MIDRTAELTEASGAVIELVVEDELVFRAASGMAAKHIGFHIPIEGSLSGEVVKTRTLLRCDDCNPPKVLSPMFEANLNGFRQLKRWVRGKDAARDALG